MTELPRSAASTRLATRLEGSPYQQYLYGYPHKTAYRALEPRRLREVWAAQARDSLFLYVHIPFCEMRCGFCNLFTAANPVAQVVEAYVDALEREARAVKSELGALGFARAALGGGTPTFLDPGPLARVFEVMRGLGARLGQIPMSVEVSPETATPERLEVIRAAGADRISMGVQSFVSSEVAAVKRPQSREVVHRALDAIRATGVANLNIDLIYGIEGQTQQTFVDSIREALKWQPEELYLYPLYVRPLTLLGKTGRNWDDERLDLYRTGRALLLSEGYEQVSMRMFRRKTTSTRPTAPVYRCQEDGMIGLGCGARSYTTALHYSQEWAVASRAVRGIIDDYSSRTEADFAQAHHGFVLGEHEQRRRWAILSLLAEGLLFSEYRARFASEAYDDLPELVELARLGLATDDGRRLALTEAGLERSDAIGPALHSSAVDELMHAWAAR